VLLAGRAEVWFTDRFGLAGEPVLDERVTDPYDRFNVATHVGDDHVRVEARRRSLPGAPAVFMDQVHGAHIETLAHAPDGPVPSADGLVTGLPGLTLAVLVADCLPVLIYEPQLEVVAAVHAGRRGIELDVLAHAVAAVSSLGGDPARVAVAIGPSIGPCCYEVPAQMRDELAAIVPAAAAVTRWGTPSIDLRAAAVAQLAAAGVHTVDVSPVCTYESSRHYSFRRDAVTGRFAGLIRLPA